MIECACGCGEQIEGEDKYGRPRSYISGHNRRKYPIAQNKNWEIQRRYRERHPEKIKNGKKTYYRKRKLQCMKILGNECKFCGVKYDGTNAPIFEFHHYDPSQKENGISRMLTTKGWKQVEEELTKCYLICANCHNQHHGGEW